MIIFPLSVPGKIVLIVIAVFLGMIFWGLMKPEFFRRMFRKKAEGVDEGKKKP